METTETYSMQQLRGLIVARYRTQQALAEEIGCSPQTITETLAGRSAGAGTRYAIAQSVDVDPRAVQWPDAAGGES